MNLADLAFLLGPLGAVVVVPLSLTVLVLHRRESRTLASAGVIATVATGAFWIAYWTAWGRAFNYLDALRPVPHGLQTGLSVTMSLTALGATGLVIITGLATVSARRRRTQAGTLA